MSKEEQNFNKGLVTDINVNKQPDNTTTYALNCINESVDGDSLLLSNENSNTLSFSLPVDYIPLGSVYIEEDTTVIFSVKDDESSSEIGIKIKDSYYTLVNTNLKFKITNQIQATYRLRRGCERIIYWVDGINRPRIFNIDKLDHYKDDLGNWVVGKFNLLNTYNTIPTFEKATIMENGSLFSGSYNCAIQYLDEDFNPTQWVSVSKPILIYKDLEIKNYPFIHGSINKSAPHLKAEQTTKSIKFEFDNLDKNFPYYRLAIITANTGTGIVNSVYATDKIPIKQPSFIFTGENYKETLSEKEILQIKALISSANHIEQIENRLILGNTKGSQQRFCQLQKYASQITANSIESEINMSDVTALGNPKSGTVLWDKIGYQQGEIYSFGIVYIFKDNTESPVFHIPGRSPTDTVSNMSLDNELDNTFYTSRQCDENYWGVDSENVALKDNKVRHHRFPLRTGEMYDKSITQNSHAAYKISVDYGPALTAGDYTIDFIEDPSGASVNRSVTFTCDGLTDVGNNIILFEGIEEIHLVAIIDSGGITIGHTDPYPPIATTVEYKSGVFTYITVEVIESTVNVVSETHTTNILGIKFDNIIKPVEYSDDIIGYKIVRQERTSEHKTVIDTGMLFPLIGEETYISFGNILPGDIDSSLSYKKDMYGLFIPSFAFGDETFEIESVTALGYKYNSNSGYEIPPTDTHQYIQDVMAGTSYDPAVAKRREQDLDGFTLHTYIKMSGTGYNVGLPFFNITNIEETIYLNALEYKNIGSDKILYNASVDNKIAIIKLDADFDLMSAPYFMVGNSSKQRLPLVLIKKAVSDPYYDFLYKPYYKETNNFFPSSLTTTQYFYSGDTFPSFINFATSSYYNTRLRYRDTNSGLWNFVIATATIIGGAISIYYGATDLGIASIKFGIGQIKVGITHNRLSKAYEQAYNAGLRNTLKDSDLLAEFSDNPDDDEIQYFQNIWRDCFFESQINSNLRLKSYKIPSFLPSQDSNITQYDMLNYFKEKLTHIDSSSNSGRLFSGFSSPELYEANPDYQRLNKQKIYYHLPEEYDCCSKCLECFPHRLYYSQQAFQEELNDNYRTFLPNDYRDISGESGKITNLFRIKNNLFIHTEESLWQLPQNIQERVTNEIVSFVGTGEFLSLPLREILDTNNISIGCNHKFATLKTEYGVFFVSEINRKIYQFDGKSAKNISALGRAIWFEENIPIDCFKNDYIVDIDNIYENTNKLLLNNTSNPIGKGFISVYDAKNKRVIFTKKDYIAERILADTSKIIYFNKEIFKFGTYYAQLDSYLKDGYLLRGFNPTSKSIQLVKGINNVLSTVDILYTERTSDLTLIDKSWTTSFSLKHKGGAWASMHSYLPKIYFSDNKNEFFSAIDNNFWKHNVENNYCKFYNQNNQYIIEFVLTGKNFKTEIWDYVRFYTEAKKFDTVIRNNFDKRYITFNKAIIYNTRQTTGLINLNVKDKEVDIYMGNQIKNVTYEDVILEKNEKFWSINDLKDIRVDYQQPMFNKNIRNLQTDYYTDKILNMTTIDTNKSWEQIESFRDKHLVVRLIFDTFGTSEEIKLIFNSLKYQNVVSHH